MVGAISLSNILQENLNWLLISCEGIQKVEEEIATSTYIMVKTSTKIQMCIQYLLGGDKVPLPFQHVSTSHHTQ